MPRDQMYKTGSIEFWADQFVVDGEGYGLTEQTAPPSDLQLQSLMHLDCFVGFLGKCLRQLSWCFWVSPITPLFPLESSRWFPLIIFFLET